MRLIAVTDYLGAGEYLKPLRKVIEEGDYDALLFTGGIARGQKFVSEYKQAKKEGREAKKHNVKDELTNKRKDIVRFLTVMKSLDIPSLIIPGRTDSPVSLYENIIEKKFADCPNLHFIHMKFFQLENKLFSGCGGMLMDEKEEYFMNSVDPKQAIFSMENLKSFKQEKILLFHTPPTENKILDLPNGSKYVDRVINILDPKILFYGMVKPKKKMKMINDTVVINPGPLSEGNFAEVNTSNMNFKFKNLKE